MELKVKQVKRVDGVKEAFYIPAAFGGLRLTVKHFFRNLFGSRDVVTINYPEEKRPVSMRLTCLTFNSMKNKWVMFT